MTSGAASTPFKNNILVGQARLKHKKGSPISEVAKRAAVAGVGAEVDGATAEASSKKDSLKRRLTRRRPVEEEVRGKGNEDDSTDTDDEEAATRGPPILNSVARLIRERERLKNRGA